MVIQRQWRNRHQNRPGKSVVVGTCLLPVLFLLGKGKGSTLISTGLTMQPAAC
jgi:hypothetical protein